MTASGLMLVRLDTFSFIFLIFCNQVIGFKNLYWLISLHNVVSVFHINFLSMMVCSLTVQLSTLWEYNRMSMLNLVATTVKVFISVSFL